jgi:hypothetical protein
VTISGNSSCASLGGDQLERQAERLGPRDLAQHLLLALGRARQADAAALHPAAVERPVELDRVHHHPRQRDAPAQLADEPGGVEGRAARQLVAVEQDDVALAQLREVVGDRGAADAAADDHDARAVGQLTRSRHRRYSSSRGSERLVAAARSAPRRSREVEVELGDRALDDAPGGLAGVGHERISAAPRAPGRRLAEVGLEQPLVGASSNSLLTARLPRSK